MLSNSGHTIPSIWGWSSFWSLLVQVSLEILAREHLFGVTLLYNLFKKHFLGLGIGSFACHSASSRLKSRIFSIQAR